MQTVGNLIKDNTTELHNVNDNQHLIAQQCAQTNVILQGNINQLDQTTDSLTNLILNIQQIDTRLNEYGNQINIHGNHIITNDNEILLLKEKLELLTIKINSYSSIEVTNNALIDLTRANVEMNSIQNRLNSSLTTVKNDCIEAIRQLNLRFEGLTGLSISNSTIRNTNIDPEVVLTAAMQREYQNAMDKIRNLNVSEIITNIKNDLMRVIMANNAENQTEIVNIITRIMVLK